MEPSIGRALKEGFQASRRSAMAMFWYAGCWVALAVVLLLGVMITSPPRALFEEAPAAAAPAASVEQIPPESQAPEASKEEAERTRVSNEWFKKSWPVLMLCLLLLVAASIWLSGAQIGYLVQQVRSANSSWSGFVSSGSRNFLPFLGGWVLSLLGFAAVLLSIGLIVALVNVIPDAVPRAVTAILVFLLGGGVTVAVIWALIRISFWFIAIVADQLKPLDALKSSFKATHKRWWRVAGLSLVLAALTYAVWIPSALLEWAGNAIGGPLGAGVGLIGTLSGVLGSLYLGFLSLAASIRFYEDAKPAPAAVVQ